MNELFKKYDIKGPRYTSYPPVPFWENCPDQLSWLSHVESGLKECREIDLYLHIPYCNELCWYCGCNREIDKSHKKENIYLENILKEWKFYKENIKDFKVKSVHLGGGTPNYLSPNSLDRLLSEVLKKTTIDFSSSIEIDPRVCTDEHLEVIKKHNIHRVSLGIQDMNTDVQQAINRIQPVELVEGIVKKLRQYNITSINFDLIYGLPKQNWQSLHKTIEKTIELGVDTIALYSYAHVPWKAKNQKLIKESELLQGFDKLELYIKASELLLSSGMIQIGMDHFCKVGSILDVAKKNNHLTRNFMGYTSAKAPVLIGLGASAISFSGTSFIQNQKNVKEYLEDLKSDKLPIETGHTMTDQDIEINELIQQIMCNENWNSPIPIDQDVLTQMIKDQLVIETDGHYSVLDKGRPFLRNIAMLYDYRLQNRSTSSLFSRTI